MPLSNLCLNADHSVTSLEVNNYHKVFLVLERQNLLIKFD